MIEKLTCDTCKKVIGYIDCYAYDNYEIQYSDADVIIDETYCPACVPKEAEP